MIPEGSQVGVDFYGWAAAWDVEILFVRSSLETLRANEIKIATGIIKLVFFISIAHLADISAFSKFDHQWEKLVLLFCSSSFCYEKNMRFCNYLTSHLQRYDENFFLSHYDQLHPKKIHSHFHVIYCLKQVSKSFTNSVASACDSSTITYLSEPCRTAVSLQSCLHIASRVFESALKANNGNSDNNWLWFFTQ